MMSARFIGNYDLPGALADLIGNSIKAVAGKVSLTCDFAGGARGDGHGMSGAELRQAMRPASANPLMERSPDDLGRFGWGMSSASFSQCTWLLVLTRKDKETGGCVWDLEDVGGWRMGILEPDEIAGLASPELLAKDGVEILWSNCDRLSENGTLTVSEFNALLIHTRNRLALMIMSTPCVAHNPSRRVGAGFAISVFWIRGVCLTDRQWICGCDATKAHCCEAGRMPMLVMLPGRTGMRSGPEKAV